MTAPLFVQPGAEPVAPEAAVVGQLMLQVARRAADTPRSRQTSVGLSEYADPCSRALGMKLAGRPKVNGGGSSWASTLGTWGHAGLTEEIRNGPDAEDWLLDHGVVLGGMVPGHLDAFHRPSATVMDWKFCGPTTITKYRRRIKPEYHGQIHGYGKALADEGHDVRTVAIVFFPRHHTLDDFWVWTEPLNPQVAEHWLGRLALIHDILDQLQLWDGGGDVEAWGQVPADPSNCWWCPFFNRNATSFAEGCRGRDQ